MSRKRTPRAEGNGTGTLTEDPRGDETSAPLAAATAEGAEPDGAAEAPDPVKAESRTIVTPSRPIDYPRQADVRTYFGRIEMGNDGQPTERWEATSLTTIATPYPLRLSWDPEEQVRRIRCHRVVSRDLNSIFGEILRAYDEDPAKVRAARMDLYGGCYNFRPMRSGHALSMHAYGIAIDLDAERNPRMTPWRPHAGMMPEMIVDIFLAHGWTWGGLWKTQPDPMHFQATKHL